MPSDRVRLRSVRREDSALLHQWISDRDLRISNAPYMPVSEQEHEKWLESILTTRKDVVVFMIEDVMSNQAIGSCQLLNIHPVFRSAELQIRIGSVDAQGKGLGPEAIRQLLTFGFRDLNLHRIGLNVFATNHRAIRAYEKCGFLEEGRLREAAYVDGQPIDVVVMSRLASDC